MRGLICRFSCSAMIGIFYLHSLALAGESEPFVAGYDRFYSKNNAPDQMAGQLLLTELSCTACHQADKQLSPKGGPELRGVLSRLEPSWIRDYLNAPDDVKPGGAMPHLLHQIPEGERTGAIEALIAFLSETDAIEPKIVASGGNPVAHEFWLKGDVERGRELYHQVGCVACHAIDSQFQPAKATQSDLERKIESLGLEPEELEELGLVVPKPVQPVPMSSISAKYNVRSLSMFLIAPHLIRPAGRMPSLKLQPHEAADITAYLFRRSPEQAVEVPEQSVPKSNAMSSSVNTELVDRGKKVFEQLACVNCHAHPNVQSRFAKPLAELDVSGNDKGCLVSTKNRPRFGLNDAQKNVLRTSIASIQTSKSLGKQDTLAFKLLQLNCYACHERGGRGGIGLAQGIYFENIQQVDIGDEGRMPPPLDHLGRKLTKAWIQKILEGNGDVRPHFRARMPAFADHAKSLATDFAAADQRDPSLSLAPFDIANTFQIDLEAGRQLLDAGCVQCHALRGESLPGSIGIDLADVATRIQPEWFHAFLLNPASLKKNTRMPSFFPDGKSSNPHILDGDIRLQIASIWHYLNSKDQPLPLKLEQSRSQLFELKPVDNPILLRTFMEANSGGTHAIAVGFPEQHHFAFDAMRLHIAEVWKGRFLNAQGTWYDRFAPPAIPLGSQRIQLPMESFVEMQADGTFEPIGPTNKSFQGYRLDKNRIPTFCYRVGKFDFEDRIESSKEAGLLRQIIVKLNNQSEPVEKPSIWLVLANDAVGADAHGVCTTRSNMTIQVSDRVKHQLHEHRDFSDWMIELPSHQATIEVRYQW